MFAMPHNIKHFRYRCDPRSQHSAVMAADHPQHSAETPLHSGNRYHRSQFISAAEVSTRPAPKPAASRVERR
ncbi:unnamed protein product [Sphacelaria rigidula]